MKRTRGPGFRLSDAFWAKVEPLLPVRVNPHRFGGGRPPAPARRCLDGIFFVLRIGGQWKALDATGLGPGSTAHDRFQQWVRAGFFHRLWQAALTEYDEIKGLDWSWLSADGCQTKAPLAGEKSGPNPIGLLEMLRGNNEKAVEFLTDSLRFTTNPKLKSPSIGIVHLADLAAAQLANGNIRGAHESLACARKVPIEW